MPQLIAMVIVVVGAMIYMFQTFGGTGDKIEGMAQKTSIISEIRMIKDGVQRAAATRQIGVAGGTEVTAGTAAATLEGIIELGDYFPEQVNEQLDPLDTPARLDTNNTYQAISFGADDSMEITLVNNVAGATPGLFVNLSQGTLAPNAGFLETQVAFDLRGVATFDRQATSATAGALDAAALGIASRRPADNGDGGTDTDGMFIIYFNDLLADEVVRP
ncbi:hypothetical protein [Arcobacter roscoffensis]|uniref:Uncharacterized protein n=1 Tax=Arcobacter roscoffensis TaxID=2961520 RepID=A0ABY5E6A3_9BACT|nr:hypothetical protein [Arcobacter roscoffensis]UTJ06658.1 hypothetical protein NJU99_00785 [Arcobacter roscoffensis]